MLNNTTSYEYIQRKKMLDFLLWTVMGACIILGIDNLMFQTWVSVFSLFGMALICIPLLLLNTRGKTFISATFLSVLVLVVITLNLYDGDGILDSGILAYPIFILIGTLFFGKRAAISFTLAALGSIAMIAYLEIHGQVHPTINSTKYEDLIPISILFIIAAAAIWVIVGNLEKNLDHIKKSDMELRDTYELTLEAWAKILEIHNKETEGHSRRVVELSIRLAQALGCTEEQIVNLRRGALVHDIGKLALPDEILLKPGRLDENEIKIIQKHPGYAKEVLKDIPFLHPAVDVAFSHHERWDGKGYPEGKKGDEIPFLARIFTVVDQWDALRADRVYRPAWSREKSISYLKENVGMIYDPKVVDAFLQII